MQHGKVVDELDVERLDSIVVMQVVIVQVRDGTAGLRGRVGAERAAPREVADGRDPWKSRM
jgi:hypothetical protein